MVGIIIGMLGTPEYPTGDFPIEVRLHMGENLYTIQRFKLDFDDKGKLTKGLMKEITETVLELQQDCETETGNCCTIDVHWFEELKFLEVKG